MDLLYKIFLDPFVQMGAAPDLLVQTLWEGLVSGVLYALIALGFVLIFKASGVFNFAQGIMVVFAALTLVGIYEAGVPAFIALALAIAVMFLLAFVVERAVRKKNPTGSCASCGMEKVSMRTSFNSKLSPVANNRHSNFARKSALVFSPPLKSGSRLPFHFSLNAQAVASCVSRLQ